MEAENTHEPIQRGVEELPLLALLCNMRDPLKNAPPVNCPSYDGFASHQTTEEDWDPNINTDPDDAGTLTGNYLAQQALTADLARRSKRKTRSGSVTQRSY